MTADNNHKYNIGLKEIVPEYYSSNRQVRKLFLGRHDAAIHYLERVKAASVLDVGCGDGLFTSRIKDVAGVQEVVGVDLNVNTETLNQKWGNVRFVKADILNLRYVKQFDAITALDVLEHFENIEDVLRSLVKAMKNNGYLIVSGPVESFFYKFGRFLVKGSFSQESGPGAGRHYRNIKQIDAIIRRYFEPITKKKAGFLFFDAFHINLYQLKAAPQ